LALASSEGTLQLVMRNSVDQGDEATPGANKSSLLSGERAQPVAEPSNTKPAPAPRPRVRVINTAAKVRTPPPPPERPSIEVIEGAKKRNVDFP
jgi:hypothetical protein